MSRMQKYAVQYTANNMYLNPKIIQYIGNLRGELELCRTEGYLDLDKLAKRLGVQVYDVIFNGPGVSGAILKKEDKWEIYVNKDHHINRKRFVATFELGRFISCSVGSHSQNEMDKNGNIVDRMYQRFTDSNIEANMIAMEILMPQGLIESYIKDNYSVDKIAECLGITIESVIHRIKAIKYTYI